MKHIYTLSFIIATYIFSITSTSAQDMQLWGMTFLGGPYWGGTVFSYDSITGNEAINYNFPITNIGGNSQGDLVEANGKFYGMTDDGGLYNKGVIFSFDSTSKAYQKLYDFGSTPSDGGSPTGNLIVFGTKLYGITGTTHILFSFDLSANTFTNLYTIPSSGSITLADSIFYGVTLSGGSNSKGTIFTFDPKSNIYTTKYNFTVGNGYSPNGRLTVSDSILYGTTTSGGKYSNGTIFSFNINSNVYNDMYSFGGITNDGSTPGASLYLKAGVLYGLTTSGGKYSDGILFSYNTSSNVYSKLVDFGAPNDGTGPLGGVIEYNDTLYGMTQYGGTYNSMYGTLFCYSLVTNTYTKLRDLHLISGSNPMGSFIVSSGKLYAMTSNGGANDYGVIFSLNPGSFYYQKLLDFNTALNGGNPIGSFTLYNNMLYGLTESGGDSGMGTIFSYDPQLNHYEKLFDFNPTQGANPQGGLTEFNGKLYGMTQSGGSGQTGVIFSFDPSSNTYTKLYDLDYYNNGAYPYSNFIVFNNLLFGMTNEGGFELGGTLFSFNPATKAFNKLYEFGNTNINDGIYPIGNLVVYDSTLYGVTPRGGANSAGILFSYNPFKNAYSILHNFTLANTDGNSPSGSLLLYGKKLFGAGGGGTYQDGVIFSYDIDSNTYKNEFSFNNKNADGNSPNDIIMYDSIFYGTTWSGGTYNSGVLYSYNPQDHFYKKFYDFDGVKQSTPTSYVCVVKTTTVTGVLSNTSYNSNQSKVYPNPNNGSFSLVYPKKGNYEVNIFNSIGELVLTTSVVGKAINLSINSAPGLYFVKIDSEDSTEVQKLIIE